MVWGGFCRGKKTSLHFFNGSIDSKTYLALLSSHLQPAYDSSTQMFQQENAAAHASRYTKACFLDKVSTFLVASSQDFIFRIQDSS